MARSSHLKSQHGSFDSQYYRFFFSVLVPNIHSTLQKPPKFLTPRISPVSFYYKVVLKYNSLLVQQPEKLISDLYKDADATGTCVLAPVAVSSAPELCAE